MSAPAPDDTIAASLRDAIATFHAILRDELPAVRRTAALLVTALTGGGKVLFLGNGGSAAQAQHLAAELVVRFERERRGLPAMALSADTSTLTAAGNDLGFERIFARQVEALAAPGDVVVALSTSGSSPNVIAAVMAARARRCVTIALTGAAGQQLASICDAAVLVPALRTSRIQEAHLAVGHLWCEIIDAALGGAARA